MSDDGSASVGPAVTEFVSIAVPVLNEAAHIEACLRSLLASVEQAGLGARFEILVMDGGSTDATGPIVERMAETEPAIRLCANPGRLQSAGVNLAAKMASPRASILMRADAHALYPPNFVRDCAQALRTHNASSVVVPMINRGIRPVQRAIAAAQSGRLGNGGAAHRTGGASGLVDHGHHAAFDRAAFLELGGYDPQFTHNEDAEYDARLGRAGGRIWMCRSAPIVYFPRSSLPALARQYFKHGRGRAQNLALHGGRPKLRQVGPVGLLGLCLTALVLALWNPWFALVPSAYAALCLAWGASIALSRRDAALLVAGVAVMVMHMSWACGYVAFHARRTSGDRMRLQHGHP